MPQIGFAFGFGSGHHRDIAHSVDLAYIGLYLWIGAFSIRLGGYPAEDSYPNCRLGYAGFALVLPNYIVFTTHKGSFDC